MKKEITIGFALMAIVGMLFAGFAAATTPTSSSLTNSQDNAVYIDSITTAATSNQADDGSRIRIDEINPRGDEHVSLFNLGDRAADLTGSQLSIDGGSSFILPALTLAPGNEVTVFFTDGISGGDVIFSGGKNADVLNDDSGSVSLLDRAGSSIATTTYTNSQTTLSSIAGSASTSAVPTSSSIAGTTSARAAPVSSSTTTTTS